MRPTHRISADFELLKQVSLNLILNAIQAMPRGGTLTISTNQISGRQGNRVAEVRFGDSGCGIPEKNLHKIFDPFYTSWIDGEGTGLSLSLCYAIVQEHDGHIKVESIEDRGTTISVRLPLAI